MSAGLLFACPNGRHAMNNMLARGCELATRVASKGLLLLSNNIHEALEIARS